MRLAISQRLKRDREFAGLRILARDGSPDGEQIDDFVDKNHVPYRLMGFKANTGGPCANAYGVQAAYLWV